MQQQKQERGLTCVSGSLGLPAYIRYQLKGVSQTRGVFNKRAWIDKGSNFLSEWSQANVVFFAEHRNWANFLLPFSDANFAPAPPCGGLLEQSPRALQVNWALCFDGWVICLLGFQNLESCVYPSYPSQSGFMPLRVSHMSVGYVQNLESCVSLEILAQELSKSITLNDRTVGYRF